MTRCTKCKKQYPNSNFYHDTKKKNGLTSWCRSCHRVQGREAWRRLRKKNPKKWNERRYEYRRKHHERELELAKVRRQKLRFEVLIAYSHGSPRCKCCGETEIKFLAIDHVKNDGAKQRKVLGYGGGNLFYAWLKRHRYPKGFQVLCNNCNIAKFQHGQCPHNKKTTKHT